MTFFVQSLLACLLTALLIVWLRGPAIRFGLVDHPGGRKRHGDSVPLTGGLAMSLGFFVALAISFRALGDYRVFFVSLAALAIIGVLDDSGEVSPRSKLGVQVLAALLMTSWAGHFLVSLGDLFGRGPVELAHWAIPLTVFATVAVTNGINMFDGLDGLAGGLAASILIFFSGFAWWLGDVYSLKVLVVMLGAVIGFLFFNAPHPWRGHQRVFMGDTGSLVLGFVIAWFSIGLTQREGQHIPPVLMLWAISFVLFDVFTVTVRRVVRRRDPAAPDRAHLHHILLRLGYSPATTATLIVGGNVLMSVIGTLSWQMGVAEPVLFAAFIAIGLAYVGLFLYPARLLRRVRRRNGPRRVGG